MLLGRGALVCLEVVELVSDYLESTLSRGQRRRFERHLAGCPHCTEYLAQMRENDPSRRPPRARGLHAADAR